MEITKYLFNTLGKWPTIIICMAWYMLAVPIIFIFLGNQLLDLGQAGFNVPINIKSIVTVYSILFFLLSLKP